jgi:Insertion element 4 transposase N-terminal
MALGTRLALLIRRVPGWLRSAPSLTGATAGVNAAYIVIDDAVTVAGRQAKRSDGKLPPHVMVYFSMAMALFADHAGQVPAPGSLWPARSTRSVPRGCRRAGCGQYLAGGRVTVADDPRLSDTVRLHVVSPGHGQLSPALRGSAPSRPAADFAGITTLPVEVTDSV